MPVYLCHGFRWPRQAIRIHIILQNLDDAAPEWLMASRTQACLIDNFRALFPEAMASLPHLTLLEQYDPATRDAKSQPYAYVCDLVHEVRLGIDVDEVRAHGVADDQWTALLDLRDQLAPGAKPAWYLVVCGDAERLAAPLVADGRSSPLMSVGNEHAAGGAVERASLSTSHSSIARASMYSGRFSETSRQSGPSPRRDRNGSISRGLLKVFGRKEVRTSRSLKNLRDIDGCRSQYSGYTDSSSPPPLPGTAQ